MESEQNVSPCSARQKGNVQRPERWTCWDPASEAGSSQGSMRTMFKVLEGNASPCKSCCIYLLNTCVSGQICWEMGKWAISGLF